MNRSRQALVYIVFYTTLLASVEHSSVSFEKLYVRLIFKVEPSHNQHGVEDDDGSSIKFEYDRESCQLHGTLIKPMRKHKKLKQSYLKSSRNC